MDDTPQPVTHALTDPAMQRLQRLAEGNGLAPGAITLLENMEKTYALKGIISLTANFDKQSVRYPGGVQGAKRQIMSSLAEIKQEAQRRQEQFQKDSSWIAQARHELESHEGHGWGLEDAKITFPDKTVVLAASEACGNCQGQRLITCAQCQGQGVIICPQCRGQRQETCYGCGGSGTLPGHPNQACPTCNGARFAICRMCQGRGQSTCPTCRGQRGTPCPACKGTGQITEEIAVGFTVTTHFRLVAEELPSGLRRGLDRLGIVNLAKGHADITIIDQSSEANKPPDKNDYVERPAAGDIWSTVLTPEDLGEEGKKPENPEIHYQAMLPYADLRVRFGDGRAVLISVFGKKGVLLGVPPFLDEALAAAREKMKQAAQNPGLLDTALKMRAMRDALDLVLGSDGGETALRRLYPVGLSPVAMQEILQDTRQAIKRLTLRTRAGTAMAAGVVAACVLGGIFLTGLRQNLMQGVTPAIAALIDLGILAAVLIAAWTGLSGLTQRALRRRFPQNRIAYARSNGKTGLVMLAGIVVLFVVILLFAPVKPDWLLLLMRR